MQEVPVKRKISVSGKMMMSMEEKKLRRTVYPYSFFRTPKTGEGAPDA
jgi:hypothetical protein